jgi:hypothetical protein
MQAPTIETPSPEAPGCHLPAVLASQRHWESRHRLSGRQSSLVPPLPSPTAAAAGMNKLLFADSAGPAWQKAYSNSHYGLAALLPASLVSPSDGAIAKVADVGLAAAITVHNHIALNYGEQPQGAPPGRAALAAATAAST